MSKDREIYLNLPVADLDGHIWEALAIDEDRMPDELKEGEG